MPQNGAMLRQAVIAMLLGSACLLAGCEREDAVARTAPLAGVQDGSLAWSGVLACADCDGIEVRLMLARRGSARSYRLVETYFEAGGGEQFADAGEWRAEGGVVRLQGENGGLRVYALLPDGRLQPRDAHGRPFAPREQDFLLPLDRGSSP